MKAAYAQALDRVRRLAGQRGEPELWRILEHPDLLKTVGARP
jgi:hypothetical protein